MDSPLYENIPLDSEVQWSSEKPKGNKTPASFVINRQSEVDGLSTNDFLGYHIKYREGDDLIPQRLDNSKKAPPSPSADEEASVRLAMELMQQESVSSYRQQLKFLQDRLKNDRNKMSEDEISALQLAIQEDEENEREMHIDDDDQEDNGNQFDYETLQALGEYIGDVKQERWHEESQAVISNLVQLPRCRLPVGSDNITHNQCLVCQGFYNQEEDAVALPLTMFPASCRHVYHMECISGWLRDHSSCPLCKAIAK